jgi:two-component system chemotaxis response regulator CheB
MELAPCPVIMVSALTQAHAEATIEALSRGAYDFLSKDLSCASLDITCIKNDLIAKCKTAAGQKRRPPQSIPSAHPARIVPHTVYNFAVPRIVCIGTSTGGTTALQQILPMLPAEFPAPVVIVQHMPSGFTAPFASHLNSLCSNHVKESEPNEPLLPGVIYIARAGQQLRVQRRGSGTTAHMSMMPANTPHIPSVDILMLSAAEQFAQLAMGVILTGIGNDGQQGMAAIHSAGGYTLAEDERSCTVYGMPRACAESGVLHNMLPLDEIPGEIARTLRATPSALGMRSTALSATFR